MVPRLACTCLLVAAAACAETRNDAPPPPGDPQQNSAEQIPADPPDQWTHQADAFLKQVVTERGLVKYAAVRQRLEPLRALAAQLAPRRSFATQRAKLALHINAYNLITIKQVVDHWPVKSVREVSGFFDRIKHRVNGVDTTLNNLENKIIRPLGETRIHAALVCAAVSCPPLRRGAYTAKDLGDQLDRITRRWVNDTAKNRVEDGVLKVSMIFKWYRPDFDAEPYEGVAGFLARHADPDSPLGRRLRAGAPFRIEHLEYEWALNKADQ
jgi:hypothetical protein